MKESNYEWMYCPQCRSSHYFERKTHMWQCPNCHFLRDVPPKQKDAEQAHAGERARARQF